MIVPQEVTTVFERFTDRARTIVVLAQEEARGLDHDYIGTEHLLLGLLAEPTGVAGMTLRELGVTSEGVRAAVVAIVGVGAGTVPGHIPFTPRAKKVLELSLREALDLGHNYIGTEHILLGILREGEGLAAKVLGTAGPGPAAIERAVREQLGEVPGPPPEMRGGGRFFRRRVPPPPPGGWGPPGGMPGGNMRWQPRMTPGGRAVQLGAMHAADMGPVGSQHFLRAIAEHDDSAAAAVLRGLGVTSERLLEAIANTPVTGTTDDPNPPRPAGIRVEEHEGRLTIEVQGDAAGELKDALLRFLDERQQQERPDDRPEDAPD